MTAPPLQIEPRVLKQLLSIEVFNSEFEDTTQGSLVANIPLIQRQ